MELKSKEQWRAHLAVAMESAPPVTPVRSIPTISVGEYVDALRSIEPSITDKQRSMLICHATALGQQVTMSELALRVGYANYGAANLQYGLLAGKLADAIGISRPEYLVYVFASFDNAPGTSHSRAHMYPELLAALQELGWVEKTGGSQLADRPANAIASGNMLTIQQVITALQRYGFTRPEQSGLKVVRLEHSELSTPIFVKQSSSIHARLQAPLVLHPSHEQLLPSWLSIPGIERGHSRYYHNSNLRGFPKRRNGGATDVAYGVDLGFQYETALEQFLIGLVGTSPTSAEPALSNAISVAPDDFNLQDLALTDTERDALIKVRIGQGGYRDALLAYWGGCAVTACSAPELLRASHIKPWRVASANERLDSFNGLLLTPNLDQAFDQGLISFDDDGQILFSVDLDPSSAQALNLHPQLRLRQIESRHRDYLAWHREYLFRK